MLPYHCKKLINSSRDQQKLYDQLELLLCHITATNMPQYQVSGNGVYESSIFIPLLLGLFILIPNNLSVWTNFKGSLKLEIVSHSIVLILQDSSFQCSIPGLSCQLSFSLHKDGELLKQSHLMGQTYHHFCSIQFCICLSFFSVSLPYCFVIILSPFPLIGLK